MWKVMTSWVTQSAFWVVFLGSVAMVGCENPYSTAGKGGEFHSGGGDITVKQVIVDAGEDIDGNIDASEYTDNSIHEAAPEEGGEEGECSEESAAEGIC